MMFQRWYSGIKMYLFYGPKGSGKSLYQAFLVRRILKQYRRVEKRFPFLPRRTLYINQPLTITDDHIQYWTNVRQLYAVRDADIFWDEIGKDLPAGSWEQTPKALKQVFNHMRKRGNRIFANTQVYEDVDIAVRRQVDKAYKIRKVFGSRDISATLPPIKVVFGLLMIREFDPLEIEHERDETERRSISVFPKFLALRKRYVTMYDTKAELPPYMPDTMEHIEMRCIKPNCDHRDHLKVVHRPI